MLPFAEACAHEIMALHGFFEHWFQAAFADPKQALTRLTDVLAPGFLLVSPGGVVIERERLIEQLAAAYGSWASDDSRGSITVDSIEPRHVQGDLGLLTYVERQRRPAGETVRRSTVLMQRNEASPNGVVWLHLHETWIPTPS
jgi:hypothetical protein